MRNTILSVSHSGPEVFSGRTIQELNQDEEEVSLTYKDSIEEPIPDIRANRNPKGGSGAESLFCDDAKCEIESIKLRKMAGFSEMDLLEEYIKDLNDDNMIAEGKIQDIKDEIGKRNKLIAILQLASDTINSL